MIHDVLFLQRLQLHLASSELRFGLSLHGLDLELLHIRIRRRRRGLCPIGILEEEIRVGVAHRLGHPGSGVVDVLRRHQIVHAALFDHLPLDRHQAIQSLNLLPGLAGAQADFNLHVKLKVESAGIDLHPLARKPHLALLRVVGRHDLKHLAEQLFQPGTREDPRDQFDLLLLGTLEGGHRCGRGVGKHPGIEILTVGHHPRAVAPNLLQVLEHRERVTRKILRNHRLDRARRSLAHEPAGPHRQEIIDLDHTLGDRHPRVVREIEVVEHLAKDRAADHLQIGHQIREALAVELVRHRDRRDRAKRIVIDLLVIDDIDGRIAHHQELAELRVAVPILIDTRVALRCPNLARGHIGARPGIRGVVLVVTAPGRPIRVELWTHVALRQSCQEIRRVSLGHELADRHLLPMGREGCVVVQLRGATSDEELLRGDRVHANTTVVLHYLQLDIVELDLFVQAGVHVLHQNGALRQRSRLHTISIEHHDDLFVGQARVPLDHRNLAVVEIDLDDAVLFQQRRLEPVIQNLKAVHLVDENMVDVCRRQVCLPLILCTLRLELHHLGRAGEHPHERGHGPLDHLEDIHQHHLAAVALLVSELLAVVVVERPLLLTRDLATDAADRVGNLP